MILTISISLLILTIRLIVAAIMNGCYWYLIPALISFIFFCMTAASYSKQLDETKGLQNE